jgi:hypothetical protein
VYYLKIAFLQLSNQFLQFSSPIFIIFSILKIQQLMYHILLYPNINMESIFLCLDLQFVWKKICLKIYIFVHLYGEKVNVIVTYFIDKNMYPLITNAFWKIYSKFIITSNINLFYILCYHDQEFYNIIMQEQNPI